MSIVGRLFGGDSATVDALAKQLSEAAIARNGDNSRAAAERYQEARNAYIAAAPDSPMARQAIQTRHVETSPDAGLSAADIAAAYGL
jgi:hypothetical protein